jgi:ABC-type transport system substrate-binding protein
MVPLAHVGSAVGYRADVTEAHASPLEAEQFGRLTPGDRSQFAWMGAHEPGGLYCADETDPDATRICNQALEPLYRYQPGDARTVPALATGCKATDDLTVWTCTLRKGVTFHDGNALDANDVVLTYVAQWDAEHPLHRGREGVFRAFVDRFGGFLNPRVAG